MRYLLRSQPETVTEAIRVRAKEVAEHTFRNPFDTDFADGAEPTIHVQKARGIAVQAIPAWPRSGSTLAFGRQIDELMEAGYFVLQTLIADVPLHAPRNADWVFRFAA